MTDTTPELPPIEERWRVALATPDGWRYEFPVHVPAEAFGVVELVAPGQQPDWESLRRRAKEWSADPLAVPLAGKQPPPLSVDEFPLGVRAIAPN